VAGLGAPSGRLKSTACATASDGSAAAAGHGTISSPLVRYEVDRAVSSLDLLNLDLTNETLLREKLFKVKEENKKYICKDHCCTTLHFFDHLAL
jgi:hypothetical protein